MVCPVLRISGALAGKDPSGSVTGGLLYIMKLYLKPVILERGVFFALYEAFLSLLHRTRKDSLAVHVLFRFARNSMSGPSIALLPQTDRTSGEPLQIRPCHSDENCLPISNLSSDNKHVSVDHELSSHRRVPAELVPQKGTVDLYSYL